MKAAPATKHKHKATGACETCVPLPPHDKTMDDTIYLCSETGALRAIIDSGAGRSHASPNCPHVFRRRKLKHRIRVVLADGTSRYTQDVGLIRGYVLSSTGMPIWVTFQVLLTDGVPDDEIILSTNTIENFGPTRLDKWCCGETPQWSHDLDENNVPRWIIPTLRIGDRIGHSGERGEDTTHVLMLYTKAEDAVAAPEIAAHPVELESAGGDELLAPPTAARQAYLRAFLPTPEEAAPTRLNVNRSSKSKALATGSTPAAGGKGPESKTLEERAQDQDEHDGGKVLQYTQEDGGEIRVLQEAVNEVQRRFSELMEREGSAQGDQAEVPRTAGAEARAVANAKIDKASSKGKANSTKHRRDPYKRARTLQAQVKNSAEWHLALCHANHWRASSTLDGHSIGGAVEGPWQRICNCAGCLLGKAKRTTHHQSPSDAVAEVAYDRVFMDFPGVGQSKLLPRSITGGKRPHVSLDDSTDYVFVHELLSRSGTEVLKAMGDVEATARVTGQTIKGLHTDGAMEYVAGVVHEYCRENGVEQTFTDAETSKANSRVEHITGSLMAMTRAILAHAKLPMVFWFEALNYAAWVHNNLISSRTRVTPTFAMFGRVPNLSRAFVWGSICFVRNVSKTLKLDTKFDAVATMGVVVGVAKGRSYGWRVFCPKAGKDGKDVLIETKEVVIIPCLEPRTRCPRFLKHLEKLSTMSSVEALTRWQAVDTLDEAEVVGEGKVPELTEKQLHDVRKADDSSSESSDDSEDAKEGKKGIATVDRPETDEQEKTRTLDCAKAEALIGHRLVVQQGDGDHTAYVEGHVVGHGEGQDGQILLKVRLPPQVVVERSGQSVWKTESFTELPMDEAEPLLIADDAAIPSAKRPTPAPRCPKGHKMENDYIEAGEKDARCDSCAAGGHIKALPEGERVLRCDQCDYDVCQTCIAEGARDEGVEAAAESKDGARPTRRSKRSRRVPTSKARRAGLHHHYRRDSTRVDIELPRDETAGQYTAPGPYDGEWQDGDRIPIYRLTTATSTTTTRKLETAPRGTERPSAGAPGLTEVMAEITDAPTHADGAANVVMVCTAPTSARGAIGSTHADLRRKYPLLAAAEEALEKQDVNCAAPRKTVGNAVAAIVDHVSTTAPTVDEPNPPCNLTVAAATLYVQRHGGRATTHADERVRKAAFRQALGNLEQQVAWQDGDVVAFPFKICCKDAGGNWRAYRNLINEWASYMSEEYGVQCQIYRPSAMRPAPEADPGRVYTSTALSALDTTGRTVNMHLPKEDSFEMQNVDALIAQAETRVRRMDDIQLSFEDPDEVEHLRKMSKAIVTRCGAAALRAESQGEAESKTPTSVTKISEIPETAKTSESATKREPAQHPGKTSIANIGLHRQLSRPLVPTWNWTLDQAAEGTDLFRLVGGNADPSMFDGGTESLGDDAVATPCAICGLAPGQTCEHAQEYAFGPDFCQASEEEHIRRMGTRARMTFMPEVPVDKFEDGGETPDERKMRAEEHHIEHDMHYATVMRKLETKMKESSETPLDDIFVKADGSGIEVLPDSFEMQAQNVEAWAAAADHAAALDAIMRHSGGDATLLKMWRACLDEKTAVRLLLNYTDQDQMEPEIRDALRGEDKAQWVEACYAELMTQHGMGTWRLIPATSVPTGANVFQTGWRLKIKVKQTATGFKVDRRKARFTGGGDSQVQGVDYDISTSPCPRATSVRWVLGKAADRGWCNCGVDVTGAFLLGRLDSPIYGEVPLFFGPGEDPIAAAAAAKTNARRRRPGGCPWVLEFHRGIYGAKQSARLWWQLWSHHLTAEMGFTQSAGDCCVFSRTREGKTIVIAGHVDDLCGTFNDKKEWESFVEEFLAKFPGRDEGITTDYLGVRVEQEGREDGIDGVMAGGKVDLIQPGLTNSVIEGIGDVGEDTAETPLPPSIKLRTPIYDRPELHDGVIEDDPDRLKPMTPAEQAEVAAVNYRRALGQCIYLACWTRPDIAYAVSQLARFSSPDRTHVSHVRALRHLARYLNGTRNLGLRFTASQEGGKDVVVWVDSDWATCPESRKSVTGWVITMRGAAIAWGSARQKTIAQSSTEAEVIATRDAVGELIAIGFDHKTIEGAEMPPKRPLMEDNSGCIAIAQGGGSVHTRKHIHIKYLLCREAVYNNLIEMKKADTKDMVADALTKSLDAVLFSKHRVSMMGRKQ